MSAYSAMEGVNWSTLKHMRDSALAYRYHLDVPQEDTPDLALGRLTHTLVFEPDLFERDYVIWEGGTRRGKEWSAFAEAHSGQTIFKPEEIETAVAMANAVRAHPLVQPYLVGGQFEVPMSWTDILSGLVCKAKPDWLVPDMRVLADLKTCRSIEGRRFGAEAYRYGYHCQLAHYAAGVTATLGWEPLEHLFICVEKTPPHDVGLFVMDTDALHVAQEERRFLLTMLAACLQANRWPGRYEAKQALQLPSWLFFEEEDTEDLDLVMTEG